MKSLSASVIVVAGALLVLGGSTSYVPHSDTGMFVRIVGCAVCVTGLWGWFKAINEK